MNRMRRRKAKHRRALRRLFGDKSITVVMDGKEYQHDRLWVLVYRLENC